MNSKQDRYWQSADGLALHFRDYPGRQDRPPLLCLPGLTRNARDFADLAERLAGEWRVLCPDMRGRADSAYAPDAATYTPRQYVADVEALLQQQGIGRFVSVGTSLGGIMTMLLAMHDKSRIAGALLNDIGPVLDPAGLARIVGYVGRTQDYPDWQAAAEALAQTQSVAFPEYGQTDWLAMARRIMREQPDGRIAFDYDAHIAGAFAQAPDAPPAALWPGIDALADCPVLLVRGELSDLLAADVFGEMQQHLPQADAIEVPRIGHVPMLTEPEVTVAIDRWLARIG